MVHQIQESEFTGPPLTEGAYILGTPDSINMGHQITWESYWEDGLGPAKIAVFRTESGSIFSLQHIEKSSPPNIITLYVMRGDIGEHVDEVLSALGLTTADLRGLPEGVHLRAARLTRRDDNGVLFSIGDYPCRADAEAMMNRLSRGGHKQAYFIESILDKGPSLRFPSDTLGPPCVIPAS